MQRTNKTPFMGWLGGKRALVPFLAILFEKANQCAKRLVEPFCGSCAPGIGIEFDRYWLNDINQDLILLYNILIVEDGKFVAWLGEWWSKQEQTEEHYYRIREQFRSCTGLEDWEKAAHFFWLKAHAHSGVVRYGPRGWNTPYGKGRSPAYPGPKIEAFYQHFESRTEFTSLGFAEVIAQCGEGDLVYCDPPYTPLKPTGFAKYWQGPPFAEEEHRALVESSIAAAARGAVVLISNHDTEEARKLYASSRDSLVTLKAPRSVSPTAQRTVQELVAIYGRKGITMTSETTTVAPVVVSKTALEVIEEEISQIRRSKILAAIQDRLEDNDTDTLAGILGSLT